MAHHARATRSRKHFNRGNRAAGTANSGTLLQLTRPSVGSRHERRYAATPGRAQAAAVVGQRPKPHQPAQAHALNDHAQPPVDQRKKEPHPMTDHPARGIAAGIADASAQLEDLLVPAPRDRVVAGPWPGDLTVDDHAALLPHLRDALTRLGACVEAIAAEPQYQGGQRDSLRLAGHLLARGADQLGAAQRDPHGPDPSDRAHPAQVPVNGSAKSSGTGGPRIHPGPDFPATVTPGKPTRAATPPQATGQAGGPPARRGL